MRMFGHDNNSQDDSNQGQEHYADGHAAEVAGPQPIVPQPPHDDGFDDGGVTDEAHGQSDDSQIPAPAAPAAPAPGVTDDLLGIKQEALHALTPLVGQLEQTPEEQFRTTMMMIQASDNHSLIRTAYEAAQKISSEKERAQALLDIVNEINYFTQHTQQ